MGIEEEEKRRAPPHRCRGRPETDASTDADGRGVSMRMGEPSPCGWTARLPPWDLVQPHLPKPPDSKGLEEEHFDRAIVRAFAVSGQDPNTARQDPSERRKHSSAHPNQFQGFVRQP